MNRFIRTTIGIVAGLGLAACTSHADGAPVAHPGTTAVNTTASSAPRTSGILPPRPRDVDITGLDPCKALTVEQGKELQYDRGWQRPPTPDQDFITNTPNCSYGSSHTRVGSIIAYVTNEDISTWITDPSRDTGVPPEKTSIAGFPALQITVPPSKKRHNNCQILIDVHDRQYIDVFSSQLTGGDIEGASAYCQEAQKVAGMVLENAENR